MSLFKDEELYQRVTMLVKDEDIGLVHSILGGTVRLLDSVLVDKNNHIVGRPKKPENQQNNQINELLDILKKLVIGGVIAPSVMPVMPASDFPAPTEAPREDNNATLLLEGIKPLSRFNDPLHKKYEHLTHAQRILVDYLYMLDDGKGTYFALAGVREYLGTQRAERGGGYYSPKSADGQLSELFSFNYVEKKYIGNKQVGYRITTQAMKEHEAAVQRSKERDIGKHFDSGKYYGK